MVSNILKLDKTLKINPLYEADGYKPGHIFMLAPGTKREYFHFIARSTKHLNNLPFILNCGQQFTVRYIHSIFKENFFDQPLEDALRFVKDLIKYRNCPYNGDHFKALHELGYLPLKIQGLPEGKLIPVGIPLMTGLCTLDNFAWLGLFLETLFSKTSWQIPVTATQALEFRKNAIKYTNETNPEGIEFTRFMVHDFHSRGGNPFTSIAAGLGFRMAGNYGSDTLNVIPASRYYYDFDEDEVPIFSVDATEHSVTCTCLFYFKRKLELGLYDDVIKWYYSFDLPCDGSVDNPDYLAIAELLTLRYWFKKFPSGIFSYVCDTFNTWKSCTHVIPRLKDEILARDGKLVVRGDSGDPVDIICGVDWGGKYEEISLEEQKQGVTRKSHKGYSEAEYKGVVELLWDVFGGTISSTGYKVLDPHIGAIYGDAINLERQVAIYERLANKDFACTNVVLGVGSNTIVRTTRDAIGAAFKGAWFNTEEFEEGFDIYKDPITSGGSKTSLKGFQFVDENFNTRSCTQEEAYSEGNMLKVIYEDGNFYNQTTLEEIDTNLNNTFKQLN